MDATDTVLELVKKERLRQQSLKNTGKFPYTAADPEMSNWETLAVLVEEVGEVATELQRLKHESANDRYVHLAMELVQVAAVATAWVEKLGRLS